MDCFGLGGVLVRGEDVDTIRDAHSRFCAEQDITYPLHSSDIRGGHGDFGWLRSPERAGYFMPALTEFIASQPFVATAAIIHRPGYFTRYRLEHGDQMWPMSRTAFSIVVERAAKFARYHGRRLRIVFEQTGRKEDQELKGYLKDLKRSGPPFSPGRSAAYTPLEAADFSRIVLGDAEERTKGFPMTQLADLVLYPIAKAGYDGSYRPYLDLKAAGKLVTSELPDSLHESCGIKYSCFDTPERLKAQTGA